MNPYVTLFAAVAVLGWPRTSGAQDLSSIRLNAQLAKTALLPLEPLELELTMENGTRKAVEGVPMLTFDDGLLSVSLERNGKPIPWTHPVLSTAHGEGQKKTRTLEPGDRVSAKFSLAYDWSSESFPCILPGEYTIVIRAAAPGSGSRPAQKSVDVAPAQRTIVSNVLTFRVLEPDASQMAELQQLHFTCAYPYTFAPDAIVHDRDADVHVARLLQFAADHPQSPFATNAMYVAARLYHYRSAVTWRDDATRSGEFQSLYKKALGDYVAAGRGDYLAEAKREFEQASKR